MYKVNRETYLNFRRTGNITPEFIKEMYVYYKESILYPIYQFTEDIFNQLMNNYIRMSGDISGFIKYMDNKFAIVSIVLNNTIKFY